MLRFLVGVALAAAISAAAARAGALTRRGGIAAALIGAVAVAAGWGWGILLVVFFVLTSGLSRYGADRKRTLTRGVLAKGERRDMVQVLANGGMFAIAAIVWLLTGMPVFLAAGAGALAAAAADSWATEIGIALGGQPRSIISGRPLHRGVSGGVTLAGTLGGVAGAAVIADTVLIIGWPLWVALAAGFAGASGMIIDSILGATLQARRYCAACGANTEQPVHICGRATLIVGGARWMDNDVVNALSTLSGSAIAGIIFLVGA